MASTIEEPMPLRCRTFTYAENRLASPIKGKRHAGGHGAFWAQEQRGGWGIPLPQGGYCSLTIENTGRAVRVP